MNGIINLDKPPGMSSARAVSIVKRLLPKGTKIGHAGTLDPFATGVLLLLVGRATKLCEQLMGQPKQYDTTVMLGATSRTDDVESPPVPLPQARPVSQEQLAQTLQRFVGPIQQRPPAFSAMWVAGRRAYDLARKGHEVQLPARTVQVYGIQLLEYAWPAVRLRIDCGRGTYIRALARDLGEALDTGGYLSQLRRTRIGAFSVETSITLEQIKQSGVETHLRQMQG